MSIKKHSVGSGFCPFFRLAETRRLQAMLGLTVKGVIMRKSRMLLKCGANNRLICKEKPICDVSNDVFKNNCRQNQTPHSVAVAVFFCEAARKRRHALSRINIDHRKLPWTDRKVDSFVNEKTYLPSTPNQRLTLSQTPHNRFWLPRRLVLLPVPCPLKKPAKNWNKILTVIVFVKKIIKTMFFSRSLLLLFVPYFFIRG